MFLHRIHIKNFRGLRDVAVDFDEQLTVFIGSNNIGKTSILDAVQICLSRAIFRRAGAFANYDFHLVDNSAQPQSADPIDITLTFSEKKDGEWSSELNQTLHDVINITNEDSRTIILNITSRYNSDVGDFPVDWKFLDPQGNPLPTGRNTRNATELQRLVPVFYLAALRDADQQFRAQSPFWGPFLRSLKVDTTEREEIEAMISALNDRVISSHAVFATVRERLQGTSQLVPLSAGDAVSIEAIPAKVFDILSRTQVLLSGKTGAKLPISSHGEGTQSLAVICLFQAFLEAKLLDSYSPDVAPILALEEPEAHLHPSAIRAVGSLLSNLGGQKIIATHSGDLVATVQITSLRRLCRVNGDIKVHQVVEGSFTQEEIRKIDHHVRLSRGGLLFAPFWLLVEGETEVVLFQECARMLHGVDLFSKGVCCIDFQRSVGAGTLIKLADKLGIDWFLLADNDSGGQGFVTAATAQLNGRSLSNHINQLPSDGGIEAYLCSQGFEDIYEANISDQKNSSITAAKGTPPYWEQIIKAQSDRKAKPALALEIVSKIEAANGGNMPVLFKDILEMALTRAGEAG
ncbi:MAG: DUF2813 domain-containing protein [Chloroflexi bacterium]|nr:DUF2813 domain-containing protein [Chloroflexota bacterium]